jgi:uncharacterized protein involved in exopolysaccharide biosynthesis
MVAAPETIPDDDSGLDLVGLWRLLWSYRWLLIVCGFVSAGIGVVLALTTDPVYRGEAVIAEVRDDRIGGAAGLANEIGGLASLAGVNLFNSGLNDRNAVATLKSRFLAEEFIKRHKLEPILHRHSTKPANLWQTVEDFRAGTLQVREDKRNGLTTVEVEWTDPALAARWANDYVALANEIVRGRVIAESSRNVEYLNAQIAKTTVVEMQRVMYNLIESETKTLMLANARTEYAFRVVDPAVEPRMRIRPKRTAMVLSAGILGGTIGLILIFLHRFALKVRRASQKS